ncbi:helix-turn-helix transcriptional regulator [Sanguibacter sp. 25GB23B1]|uniref:helix-turn-helix domain-containing protein n=1 Tax=unclassified Sanguibacter TaxID=2645534 RepID=UPI0032AEE028
MDSDSEFGAFLRGRRALLDPEVIGVVSHGRRRVPGLRREELAHLAGVSPTYYTRLEQGQSTGASDSVLDALSRALRLTPDERRHLHDLARPARTRPVSPRRWEAAGVATRQLVAAVDAVPMLVLNRRNDVLVWNPLAHALLAGHLRRDAPDHPDDRPNTLRMLFLDPHTRELYSAWADEARRAVAALRLTAGEHANDPALTNLIGDLVVHSDEFAALWAEHPVTSCSEGTKHYRHPSVGQLELAFTMTTTTDGSGHRLLALTAEPDSPSQHALRLLADTSAEHS